MTAMDGSAHLLEPYRVFDGVVHFVDGPWVLASRGFFLFQSLDGGGSWHPLGQVPVGRWRRAAVLAQWSARLTRSEIRHAVPLKDGVVLIWTARSIYRLVAGRSTAEFLAPIVGSRPLFVCVAAGAVYYGEYRSNPGRSEVAIWCSHDGGENWQRAFRFDGVRHIHGVFHDPFTDRLWVTTGDEDPEVGIWCAEPDSASLSRIWGGKQQFRAVQLLFTREFIYFGSDTPRERNHLYRVPRDQSTRPEPLQAVGGSVFFGARVGSTLCFSTVREPSAVNTVPGAELWASEDGDRWARVALFRRDCLPLKYFQYPQVRFAQGPGDGSHVWLSPFATQGRQGSYRVPLEALRAT